MPTRTDLQELAQKRIEEAEVLWQAGYYEGAFHVAGYAIEISLKAAICKHSGIDYLFSFPESTTKPKEISTVFDKLKTHDLDVLVILAGLYQALRDKNQEVFVSWSTITQMKWTEQVRYNPRGKKMETGRRTQSGKRQRFY